MTEHIIGFYRKTPIIIYEETFKNMKLLCITLLTSLSLTAQIVDPAETPTVAFNLADLKFGAVPPVLHDGILSFSSNETQSSSAQLPQAISLEKGLKLEIEFKVDKPQDNPYPRLFECGPLSVQLQADEQSKMVYLLKVLVPYPKSREHALLTAPIDNMTSAWHTAVVTFEPKGHFVTLSLDNGPTDMFPLDTDRLNLSDIMPVIGSSSLESHSVRALNGDIRRIAITTPYDPRPQSFDGIKPQPPTINGKPVEHFTVCAVRNRHLAFPGFAVLPSGDWAAVFREGEAHVCPYGRICIVYSKDQGRHWSAPICIADSASDLRDPSIHALSDGRILVTHGGWNSWMHFGGTKNRYPSETEYIKQAGPQNFGNAFCYLFSSDNGESWTKTKIRSFAPHGPCCANGRFYQPRIIMRDGRRVVQMLIGNADATEWKGPYTIADIPYNQPLDFQEPHTACLPDGTLITALREPNFGYMYTSSSTDDGVTWSEPVKTPVRGFPIHLLPLKDGRLLATYGYRYYPFGVRACLSHDGGRAWDIKNELVIQNNGMDVDLGYPVSMQLQDGSLVTVYYHQTSERPTCFIEGARWRLD